MSWKSWQLNYFNYKWAYMQIVKIDWKQLEAKVGSFDRLSNICQCTGA